MSRHRNTQAAACTVTRTAVSYRMEVASGRARAKRRGLRDELPFMSEDIRSFVESSLDAYERASEDERGVPYDL
jgi:hypothetical protein